MGLSFPHEVSIAGIYFHWLVPFLIGGFLIVLFLKFILKISGLIQFIHHHNVVVLTSSLGICSAFSLFFIGS